MFPPSGSCSHRSRLVLVLRTLLVIGCDEYNKWKNATAGVELRTKQIQQSSEAYGKIIAAHADLSAKLMDKERELTAFRVGESDRVLRGLQKNFHEQELEYDRMLANMAIELNKMTGKELEDGERRYLEMIRMRDTYLKTVSRLELERAAEAVGIDRLLLRSFKFMTKEQLEEWIRLRLAANDYMEVLKRIANGFRFLADVFDKSGEGTLSWLAMLVDLLREAEDVGTRARMAFYELIFIYFGGNLSSQPFYKFPSPTPIGNFSFSFKPITIYKEIF